MGSLIDLSALKKMGCSPDAESLCVLGIHNLKRADAASKNFLIYLRRIICRVK